MELWPKPFHNERKAVFRSGAYIISWDDDSQFQKCKKGILSKK